MPEVQASARRLPAGGFGRVTSRVFSFPVFLAIALVPLAVLTVRDRFHDPDTWWHLKNGEIIWTTGTIPRVDLFSYTAAGHPWTSHSWLSDLTIYASYHVAGYPGMMLLFCLWTSSFCILLYLLGWIACGNPKIALIGALVGWLFGTSGYAVRPQMVGSQLLIVELIILYLSRKHDRRWLWSLPPLFALWVNSHPSQTLGFIVLGAFWICSLPAFRWGLLSSTAMDRRDSNRILLVIVLCAAALFVNPLGWKLPFYSFELMLRQKVSQASITEFAPVDLMQPRGMAMILVLVLIFSLVLLRKTEMQLFEVALIAMGTVLGIKHQRMAVVFGTLAVPVITRMLAGLWEGYDPSRDSRLGNLLVSTAAILVALFSIPGPENLRKQVAAAFPAGAVDFIHKSNLPGPMFNEFVWGGYLMWALPERKIFIDGRADFYDYAGVLAEYGNWYLVQEDPRRLLDKYGVKFCLLTPTAPEANVLPLLPGWREVYRDSNSVIFAR